MNERKPCGCFQGLECIDACKAERGDPLARERMQARIENRSLPERFGPLPKWVFTDGPRKWALPRRGKRKLGLLMCSCCGKTVTRTGKAQAYCSPECEGRPWPQDRSAAR